LDGGQLLLERHFGNGSVIRDLPAQPPTVAEAEVSAEPKVSVSRDGALARDDLSDPLCRYADVFGEAVLRKTKWFEEFFFKHLAGRDR